MSTKRPNTTSTASADLKVGDRIWMIRSAHYRNTENRPVWDDKDPEGSRARYTAWKDGEGAPMVGARTISAVEIVWHGGQRRGERRSRYYRLSWAEGGRTDVSAPSRHPVITEPAPELEAPATVAPASEEAPTLKLVLVDHCPQGSLF